MDETSRNDSKPSKDGLDDLLEPHCSHCGSLSLRYDPETDTVDCVDCGGGLDDE